MINIKNNGLWMRNIDQNKRINILLKDEDSNIIYTETIIYDKTKYKTCNDVSDYISDKFNCISGLNSNYDKTTKINYTYKNAKNNGDLINWKIDFDTININEAFKGAVDNSITINICNVPYGLGCTNLVSIAELIEILKNIVKAIIWIIRYIYVAINPYKILENLYHKDKDFINKTIERGKEWKCGFITNENIEFKKHIEKSIMKKLGYKKNDKKWIRHI